MPRGVSPDTGRPRKEIDREQFEKLCRLHCTLEEISGWFSVSDDTIERWCKREYKQTFAVIYAQKRAGGRISLRRKQYEIAMHGNVAMLIFLGKNILGQKDKIEFEGDDKREFVLKYAVPDKPAAG